MMNTLLLSSVALFDTQAVEAICRTVFLMTIVIAVTYLLAKAAPACCACFKREDKGKDEEKAESPEEAAYKREEKRRERVRVLMKEICEITKDFDSTKGNDGTYNDSEARKLFELYKQIDRYDKTVTTSDGKTA